MIERFHSMHEPVTKVLHNHCNSNISFRFCEEKMDLLYLKCQTMEEAAWYPKSTYSQYIYIHLSIQSNSRAVYTNHLCKHANCLTAFHQQRATSHKNNDCSVFAVYISVLHGLAWLHARAISRMQWKQM